MSEQAAISRPLSRKLLFALLLLALVLAVTAISAGIGLKSAQDRVTTLIEDRIVPLSYLKTLSDIYAAEIVEIGDGIRREGADPDGSIRALSGARQQIGDLWGRYMLTYLTPDERRMADTAKVSIDQVDTILARVEDLLRRGDRRAARDVIENELRPAVDATRSSLQPLAGLQLEIARDEYRSLSNTRWQSAVVLIFALLTGIAAIVGGSKVALGLARASAISEDRYRLLAENSSDIISLLDDDLAPTFVSPASRVVLGYEPRDLLGHPVLQLVHPDEYEAVATAFRECLAGRECEVPAHRCRRSDGSYVWIECRTNFIRGMDGGSVLIAASRDVTHRRAAEQALRESHSILDAIVEGTADPICVTGRDGRTVFMNMAAKRVLSVGTDEPARRPAEFEAHFREQDERVIRTEATLTFEDTIVTNEGPRFFLSTKTLWRSPDGEILGVFTIAHDITNLKRNQADLEQARDEAEAGNRAKSTFLANMSHELRTPLNAVIGFAEVIESEIFGPLGSPKYGDYAASIRKGGQHLLRLISEILDLSKVEAGQLVLAEMHFDIGTTIRESVALLHDRAEKSGVTIGTNTPPDLPCCRGDEQRIVQALLNLISNAVKFTPPGGRVTIGAEIDHAGRLAVTVEDSGIGIAAADLPKLFRPFSQVGNVMTRTSDGTGLGLVIAKQLVELHEGTLQLESRVGHGTIARMLLPRERLAGTGRHAAGTCLGGSSSEQAPARHG